MRIMTVTVARQLLTDLDELHRELGRSGRRLRPKPVRSWRGRRAAEPEIEAVVEPLVPVSALTVEVPVTTRAAEREPAERETAERDREPATPTVSHQGASSAAQGCAVSGRSQRSVCVARAR